MEKILTTMEKTPTANEFIANVYELSYQVFETYMIEFAKLHVTKALEAASKKAEVVIEPNCSDHTPYRGECGNCGRYDNPKIPTTQVSKESILTSYPETNIV